MLSILTLVIVTIITTSNRDFEVERNSWGFDGIISKKYNSNNHSARTITVGNINYEFFPVKLWDKLKSGDKIIKKSCEDIVLVNGQKFRFQE